MTVTIRDVEPFQKFDVWVLAFDPPGGMEAFEFSLTVPPGIIVADGRRLCPGCSDFDFQRDDDPVKKGDNNFIIGTGGVCFESPGTWMLVRYAGCMSLEPFADASFCVNGAAPSSFRSREPGYLICSGDSEEDLREFVRAYDGCAVANPTTIATEHVGWGAMKGRYRQ